MGWRLELVVPFQQVYKQQQALSAQLGVLVREQLQQGWEGQCAAVELALELQLAGDSRDQSAQGG